MATESPRLDAAERLAKLMREVLVLAVCVYLAWYLVPLLPQFTAQLNNAKVTDVDLGGIKLKLQQAEGALEAVVRNQAPEKGNVDERASEQAKLVGQALDTVRSASKPIQLGQQNGGATLPSTAAPAAAPPQTASSYWVYIGAYKDGRWQTKYFDISGEAHVGTTLRASSNLFRRQSAPSYANDDWLLGAPMGVLQAGNSVKVLQVQTIPGTGGRDLVWAEVVPQ